MPVFVQPPRAAREFDVGGAPMDLMRRK